ncbi:YciI family protein [Janthinobacterium sp.]|uniref:YciI family protein n=1 Tax=Janthinobacterium sp. TaxID=1871054 RepID=UPI00293D7A82|nr:YciI family protein [Janthinobacterium sp.]
MFIVTLTYLRPPEVIDAALEAHRVFLREQYAAGVFLMSGRLEPRTGGVILAHGLERAALEALLRRDPFRQQGIASYAISEFVPTMTADAFSALRRD